MCAGRPPVERSVSMRGGGAAPTTSTTGSSRPAACFFRLKAEATGFIFRDQRLRWSFLGILELPWDPGASLGSWNFLGILELPPVGGRISTEPGPEWPSARSTT